MESATAIQAGIYFDAVQRHKKLKETTEKAITIQAQKVLFKMTEEAEVKMREEKNKLDSIKSERIERAANSAYYASQQRRALSGFANSYGQYSGLEMIIGEL